jgi:hypothetical protein
VHGSISFIAICSCYSFPGDTRLIADLIFRHATGSRPAHRALCPCALLKITMYTLGLVTKTASVTAIVSSELRLYRPRNIAIPRNDELVAGLGQARPCALAPFRGARADRFASRRAVLGGIGVPLAGSACSRSACSERLRTDLRSSRRNNSVQSRRPRRRLFRCRVKSASTGATARFNQ